MASKPSDGGVSAGGGEPFIPSKTFAGPKAGYAFRTSDEFGTGYHLDGDLGQTKAADGDDGGREKKRPATDGTKGPPAKRAKVSSAKTKQKQEARDAKKKARLAATGQKKRFSRGQHRGETFAEVARNDPDYHVRYQYILNKKGQSAPRELAAYAKWFSDCGKVAPRTNLRGNPDEVRLGDERFRAGRHKGRTFRQVARTDPSYHLRCQETGYSAGGDLGSYECYFDRYGDHQAALRGEREAIGAALGIFF